MIALKKKPSSRTAYNWRPDFRSHEDLADLQAVRTRLFMPAACIGAAVLFVAYILFQEYKATQVYENIEILEAEIAGYSERHDEKVAQNAEFMKISNTLGEILEFKSGKLAGSDFLLALSSRLFEGLYLTKVEYTPGHAVIDGSAQVSAEEASRMVNRYLQSLEEGDVLQGHLTEYKLTSLERNASGNNINFRIEVTKGEGK